MDRGDTWRAVTPWSFFLPTLLAAALGVFIANAASRMVFGEDAAPAEGSAAAPAKAANPDAPASTPAEAEAATQPAEDADTATVRTTPVPPASAPAKATAPLSLPGPGEARRNGEERACISGTVARRAENGWEQEMADDVPTRCMATSA